MPCLSALCPSLRLDPKSTKHTHGSLGTLGWPSPYSSVHPAPGHLNSLTQPPAPRSAIILNAATALLSIAFIPLGLMAMLEGRGGGRAKKEGGGRGGRGGVPCNGSAAPLGVLTPFSLPTVIPFCLSPGSPVCIQTPHAPFYESGIIAKVMMEEEEEAEAEAEAEGGVTKKSKRYQKRILACWRVAVVSLCGEGGGRRAAAVQAYGRVRPPPPPPPFSPPPPPPPPTTLSSLSTSTSSSHLLARFQAQIKPFPLPPPPPPIPLHMVLLLRLHHCCCPRRSPSSSGGGRPPAPDLDNS